MADSLINDLRTALDEIRKVRYFVDSAVDINIELSSYLSRLWKKDQYRNDVLVALLDFNSGLKTPLETFDIIRNRSLQTGVVNKFTHLRDAHLMFAIYALKSYMTDEDPQDSYGSDEEEEEEEEAAVEEDEEEPEHDDDDLVESDAGYCSSCGSDYVN